MHEFDENVHEIKESIQFILSSECFTSYERSFNCLNVLEHMH